MSLEGLNALIQLESTRMESAKSDSNNSQQLQSTIQQRGLNTAQSKLNIHLQKIDAQYTKECAEADVRKLESRLARHRKAEALALQIAGVATALNFAGNAGHFVSDLLGAQKLGDLNKSLQSPALNQDQVRLSVNNKEGSTGNTSYISGLNKEGSETVYVYNTNGNGTTADYRTATITNQDKEQIGGDEYKSLVAANNGHHLSFAEIQEKNPELADKIINDKSHGMAKGEVDNFLNVTNNIAPLFDQHDRIKNGLVATGKLDDSSKVGKVVKGFGNMLVQTLQESKGYFDAYMSMKDKADNIEEELKAAKDKLAAAKRRLQDIEISIDDFAGRGA